jgi:hypothetical protein
MRLSFTAVLFSSLIFLKAPPQSPTVTAPVVTLALPESVKSETVQIVYYMGGQFGGHGGYVKAETGVNQYEIRAEAEGRPAQTIKILVYAPGCRIQKFDLVFSGDDKRSEPILCEYLTTTRLSGKIPPDLAQQENAEIGHLYGLLVE